MGRKLTPEEIYQHAHLQQNQFVEEEPPKRKAEKSVKLKSQRVQREDRESMEPVKAEQATQEIEVPSHPAEEVEIGLEKEKQDNRRDLGTKTPQKARKPKGKKKPCSRPKLPKISKKQQKKPESDPLWTGQTTIVDLIAPTNVDTRHRDYIVVDGIYHAYLYIVGYDTKNMAGCLTPLVDAGDNVSMSFYLHRMPRDKMLNKVSHTTMFNRSRMQDIDDTRTDFEELDSAIYAGMYLKERMNREGQDFYYMSTLLEVVADDVETLEKSVAELYSFCISINLVAKRADYKHEQCFLSSLPCLSLDSDIERKSRRNVLTESAAAAFPFSSYKLYDENGVFLGVNTQNYSSALLDIFDTNKYSNGNVCIMGKTGAGKMLLMQVLGMRLREQAVQVFFLVPQKGHEFSRACLAMGGKYIRISASSEDCINLLDIRRRNLNSDYELGRTQRNDSILADKIQNIMPFFHLLKKDLTEKEQSVIEDSLIKVYADKGITFENSSLFLPDGSFQPMPTLSDLYHAIPKSKDLEGIKFMLKKFVDGSLQNLGKPTNVDLENGYIVFDIDMTDELLPIGTFIALDCINDKIKTSIIQKKVLFFEEVWMFEKVTQAMDYVMRMYKTIRGLGGAAVSATQSLQDHLRYDNGKYGEELLNASEFKLILQVEEKECRAVCAPRPYVWKWNE